MLIIMIFSINLKDWEDFIMKYSVDADRMIYKEGYLKKHLEVIHQQILRVPWRDKLNDYLIKHYIIPPRITQEPLDNFSVIYKDTLFNIVKDIKDMKEAVLKINEWCFTKMDYKPTERWDFNATTIIRSGYGRCEEMSILLMKALRTICIPVREAYTPRWPFTESNHAWVEVWIDGKWHYIGAAEPTDIDFPWFRNPVKRTALVLSPVFGKLEEKDVIFKSGKRWTLLNTTENYTDVSRLKIFVLKDKKIVKNAILSFSIYNFSYLSPLLIDTLKNGIGEYILGKTEYFIYASSDSFKGIKIFFPQNDFETLYIEIEKKEISDTSFFLHCKKPQVDTLKPYYNPDIDSLKKIKEEHLKMLCSDDTIPLFRNALGNRDRIYSFFLNLNEKEREDFLLFFKNTHEKDLVFMDTIKLKEELYAIENSLKFVDKGIPDSIIEKYLIPERILYEEFGFYKYIFYERFRDFLKKENPPLSIFEWVKKNIKRNKDYDFFKPLQNPLYTYRLKLGTDIERYILIVGILRSLGIPSKIRWDYKGICFYKDGWKELSFEKEKKEERATLIIKFMKDKINVSKDFEYYENYTIERFFKYPEELEPDIEKEDSSHKIFLKKDLYYLISGFRNVNGDAFVRIKKIDLRDRDSIEIIQDVGIPENAKSGELLLREYNPDLLKKLGIEERGKILIIFLDISSESSRSTLINAKDELNNFEGRIYYVSKDKKGTMEFLLEQGMKQKEIKEMDEEEIKSIGIKDLPSILYIKDNEPVFWIDGLILHLGKLLNT
uniref:Transglutaminase domain-containing protein n=1 Tax=candidate division WOR-3 bacterium TaxID=2052148 RepID=A0A7C4U6W1_UNCW3